MSFRGGSPTRFAMGQMRRLLSPPLLLSLAACFLGIFPAGAAEKTLETGSEAFSRLYFGLQPVADRDAERTVALIVELLQGGRFSEAAPLVQRAFEAESDVTDGQSTSLRRRLAEELAALPPEGAAVLLNVLGDAYDARLDGVSDVSDLRALIASHPPELFGADALTGLAQLEAAVGDARAAAQAYRLARELEAAQGIEAPEWRLYREAANWLRSGAPSAAEELIPLSSISATIAAAPPQDGAEAAVPPAPWWRWRAAIADPSDTPVTPDDQPPPPTRSDAISARGQVVVATGSRLVAINSESGKRLWTHDFADGPARRSDPIAGVSTDGRLVFAIAPSAPRGVDFQELASKQRRSVGWYRGRVARAPANRLVALELATGGKVRWRIDGGEPDSPLRGAAFLGPPLAAGSRLYVLTAQDQSINVVELDAATGRVDWVQPLVRFERSPPPRVLRVAITPTLGERFLYCPTGRGAVVAVDTLRRRLAWTHYVPVGDDGPAVMRRRGLQAFGANLQGWDDDDVAWREARITQVGDRLVVATPASPALEVIRADDGQSVWKRGVKQGVCVEGVVDGVVVVAQTQSLVGYRLEDGETLWNMSLEDAGASGPGLLLGDHYLAPLKSNRFAWVNVTGENAGELQTFDPGANPLIASPQLGGLMAVNGSIVSFDQQVVASYPQIGPRDALPTDFAALERLAKVRPNDRIEADRLAAALLSAADADASHGRAADLIERLGVGPRCQAYAALLRVKHANRTGATNDAAALALRLADSPAGRVIVDPEPGLEVAAARLAWGDTAAPADEAVSTAAARSPGDFDWRVWATNRVNVSRSTEERGAVVSSRSLRRSSRNEAIRRPRPFAIDDAGAIAGAPRRWLVAPRNDRPLIVGAGPRGEVRFSVSLREERRRLDASRGFEPGSHRDLLWRDRLVLRQRDGYAVFRLDAEGGGNSEPIWVAEAKVADEWPQQRERSAEVERPVAAGPWGVVSLVGNRLLCRDVDSGRLVWRRDLIELGGNPPRVLSVGDRLYLAGDSESGWTLSAWTGRRTVNDWSPPAINTWKAYRDGSLLVEERAEGGRRYAIYRIESGAHEPTWTRSLEVPTSATMIGSQQLALLSGRELSVIDLASATEAFSTSLPGDSKEPVQALRVSRNGDCLLVEVDRAGQMVDTARGAVPISGKPLLTGSLHCLDAVTGAPRWLAPAEVDRMALLDLPVEASPLLLLARASPAVGDGEDQKPPRLTVVALVAATGATVFRAADLPADLPATAPAAWAQLERPGPQRLLARVGRNWFDFQTTQNPAPPRPPMRASVEDPEAARPGIDDIMEGTQQFLRLFDESAN